MRILIIGNTGSGKAALGERLGRELDMPIAHLDLITWKRDFRKIAETTFRQRLAELMTGQDMIIEGWGLQSTMRDRLKWAQVIIYLCFPLDSCVKTIAARNLEYNHKKYPYDVFEGNRLALGAAFINSMTHIHEEYEPQVQVWLKETESKKLVYSFYSPQDLDTSYDAMIRRIRTAL